MEMPEPLLTPNPGQRRPNGTSPRANFETLRLKYSDAGSLEWSKMLGTSATERLGGMEALSNCPKTLNSQAGVLRVQRPGLSVSQAWGF